LREGVRGILFSLKTRALVGNYGRIKKRSPGFLQGLLLVFF